METERGSLRQCQHRAKTGWAAGQGHWEAKETKEWARVSGAGRNQSYAPGEPGHQGVVGQWKDEVRRGGDIWCDPGAVTTSICLWFPSRLEMGKT